IYLGAYALCVEAYSIYGDNCEDARFGGRLRFKYFF
ncbi:carbohydrate porin, partial [Salmonella enterica]